MSNPMEKQLYAAAKDDRVSEVFSLLRDHPNINVNWADPDNQWKPLHIASCNGHDKVVKLLLAHPNINVNSRNRNGDTPFSLGCYNGRVSVVEVLLKDPRVNITLNDNDGRTPLWYASYHGQYEIVEWLIASGRDLGDIENKKGNYWGDDKEYTALEIARERNKTKVVSLLERFMANPAHTRHEVHM